MAQQFIDNFRIDRRAMIERTLAAMRKNGDTDAANHAQAVLGLLSEFGADPLDAILGRSRSRLIDAMVRLGCERSRLELVEVGVVPDVSHTAAIIGFLDGSAAVRVSETLLGVIDMYARHLTRGMVGDSLRTQLGAALRRIWKGRAELDGELLALSVRYHMLHLRTLALPSTPLLRLSDYGQSHADIFASFGIHFVLAHEMAHHALGHHAPHDAAVTACTGEPQLESAADELAVRAVLAVRRASNEHLLHAVHGMLAATMALYAAESSLFARVGVSHPPVLQRADLVCNLVPMTARAHLEYFRTVLVDATERANVFIPGVDPALPWQRLRHDLDIARFPHSLHFLDTVEAWDRLQAEDAKSLALGAAELGRDSPSVLKGLTDLRQHGPEAALRAWGVRDSFLCRIADAALPVTFSALRKEIELALPGHSIPDDSGRALTDRLALLTEYLMKGNPVTWRSSLPSTPA